MEVKMIDLDKIEQNENTRVKYKVNDLADLMSSMKTDGLLQPVGVRELPSGKYDAVFGNRRIEAARKLGWIEIPCNIMGADTDTDRDVLNLVENIKRQNTTVSEDGRMFDMLMERGLSIAEIAARVGISVVRIETALEVYRQVPKEYQRIIVNRTSGTKTPGTISASAAETILGISRKEKLTKAQTGKLFDFAKKDETTLPQLRHVAPLIKEGASVEQAIKTAGGLVRIALTVFVDAKDMATAERKLGMSYSKACYAAMQKQKELRVKSGADYSATYNNRDSKNRRKLTTIAAQSLDR